MKKLMFAMVSVLVGLGGCGQPAVQCDTVDASVACLCQSSLQSGKNVDTFCDLENRQKYVFGIGKAEISFSSSFSYQKAASKARTALAQKIQLTQKEHRSASGTVKKATSVATVKISSSHSWEDKSKKLIYVVVGMKKSDFDAAQQASK